jgi:hypothetical protein
MLDAIMSLFFQFINPLIIFTLYSNFRESGIEETLSETGSGI